MDSEQRDAVRKSNQRRAIACRKCGSTAGLREVDGSRCGGMPGINYKLCDGCGHAQPITKRQCRERL